MACATASNAPAPDSGIGASGSLREGAGGGAIVEAGGVLSEGGAPETGSPQPEAATDFGSDATGDAMGQADADATSLLDAAGSCPSGALVCDDFETYTSASDLSAAWTVTATAATVQVDATKPFKGKLALHISTPGGGMTTALITKQGAPLFPVAGNAFYGRMMVWLSRLPSGGVHWNNMESSGLLPNSTQTAKYAWGGDGMLGTVTAGYTIRNDPASTTEVVDCLKSSATPFPVQRWACVEWQFDGGADEMHYWLDGNLLADVDIVKTGGMCVTAPPPGNIWVGPVFSSVSLGWMEPNASSAAIEMWLDEVVLDTQRIGCPTP
jgi:hypothetical protein